jgi:hypothetical protein
VARRPRPFTSINSAALRRCGVTGPDVVVRLEGSTLMIVGEDGGAVAIPAASVDLIRQFSTQTVHSPDGDIPPLYETKIWWDGRSKPALLIPVEDHSAYCAAIAGFAGQVAAANGLERLRIGPGYATAIVNLLLVGIPCLFLFAYVLGIAMMDGGWWWPAAVAIVIAFAWLARRNLVSRWPRAVRSLDQFVAELA